MLTTTLPWREHVWYSEDELALVQAAHIAAHLGRALQTHGRALLAVSGGRSPVPLFRALAATRLAWDRVTVTLVDERLVPPHHPDSNAQLVRTHLLQGLAASACFVDWVGEDVQTQTPSALAQRVEAALAALDLPWAVAVLGMGEDGHTASWFPASEGLHEALYGERLVCPVYPQAAAHTRLTLTLRALQRFQHVCLSFHGAAKLERYRQACQGVSEQLPVSLALHRLPAIDVWTVG